MFNWILNKLGRTKPKVGEIWEINGMGGNTFEATVVEEFDRGIKLSVYIVEVDACLCVKATYKDFNNILKIRKVSND